MEAGLFSKINTVVIAFLKASAKAIFHLAMHGQAQVYGAA